MIREIRYKISADTKSIEPKTRQWAGMQYEDNATEVVFDISALGITNALCRIDFNSAGAGYQPSENLEFKDDCLRRAIPKHITQYGGEIQVTAVITVLDETGAVTGEALSWPVIVYLTAVDKSEEGSKEIEANISEIETSVRKAQEEVEETADKVAGMHHELQKVYLTADEIVEIKRDAEELIKDIETKLENGEFKGEKGDSGVYVGSGEMPDGYNVQIDPNGSAFELPVVDIVYSPTSPNPQSGIAVAEALANVGGSGGTWEKIVDITTTEEVNGINATVEEFPQISKCKEFITRIVFPKTDTALTLGALRVYINNSHAFRVNSALTATNGLTEIRCHTIIADTLVHTVGTESARGHSNVVGNAYILVGNQQVDIPQEISILLNDSATYLPIGTKIEIYGKVEG